MNDDEPFELDVPIFIELKSSNYANNDLGAFCTMQLTADQFIGNYKGKIRKSMSQCADQNYVWTILSSRQMPLFYIDATDPKDSNWLRFIRSTSDVSKYNVICMQQNQQINYFTFKEIKLGEELVTYLPNKKKKNKNKNFQNRSYKLVGSDETEKIIEKESIQSSLNKIDESVEEEKSTLNRKSKLEIVLKKPEARTNQILKKLVLFDLDLVITNKSEKEKAKKEIKYCHRSLLKCDLCSFTSCFPKILNNEQSESKILNVLEEHINECHLIKNSQENDDLNRIISELMDFLLNKIDTDSKKTEKINSFVLFKCQFCKIDKKFSKIELDKHLQSKHANENQSQIGCFYCKESFKLKSIDNFIEHLINQHVKQLESSELTWAAHSNTQNKTLFDWEKYIFEEEQVEKDVLKKEINEEIIMEDSEVKKEKKEYEEEKNHDEDEDDDEDDDESEYLSKFQEKSDPAQSDSGSSQIKEKNPKLKVIQSSKSIMESKNSKQTDSVKVETVTATATIKTWTCQMCKKQFENRIDLSKHQCIELHLKLLKKKKDIRKKKWREAHWKRKIDLSYIETTSLTQLSQNIADNLSFCIDGTSEDLKSYSREVKDYLNTELGKETEMQMMLKYCTPELSDKTIAQLDVKSKSVTLSENKYLDEMISRKANSYFIDCFYLPVKPNEMQSVAKQTSSLRSNTSVTNTTSPTIFYNCKNCRSKCRKLSELVQHQRQIHNLNIRTTFDYYNQVTEKESETEIAEESNDSKSKKTINLLASNTYSNSAIGYLACDPFAYLLNLYWDQVIQKKCENCNKVFTRPKYRKHVLNCSNSTDTDMKEIQSDLKDDEKELKIKDMSPNSVTMQE